VNTAKDAAVSALTAHAEAQKSAWFARAASAKEKTSRAATYAGSVFSFFNSYFSYFATFFSSRSTVFFSYFSDVYYCFTSYSPAELVSRLVAISRQRAAAAAAAAARATAARAAATSMAR